jgi:ADP-ribose pyrophosphatase YjhB (NUDIX family)
VTDFSHNGPRLAVSAGIFRDGKILLVRRAREPAKGVYTFPGGRVEFGESLTEALTREIREETGLVIDIVGLAGYREALRPAPAATGISWFCRLPPAGSRTRCRSTTNSMTPAGSRPEPPWMACGPPRA